jgi:hypothetical protein
MKPDANPRPRKRLPPVVLRAQTSGVRAQRDMEHARRVDPCAHRLQRRQSRQSAAHSQCVNLRVALRLYRVPALPRTQHGAVAHGDRKRMVRGAEFDELLFLRGSAELSNHFVNGLHAFEHPDVAAATFDLDASLWVPVGAVRCSGQVGRSSPSEIQEFVTPDAHISRDSPLHLSEFLNFRECGMAGARRVRECGSSPGP